MIILKREMLYIWETRLALVLIVSTPLLISTATYDSFLLPKFVWVTILAAIWLWMLSIQTNLFKPVGRVGSKQSAARYSALDVPFISMGIVFTLSVLLDYASALQFKALLICGVYVGLFYAFKSLWSRGLSEEKIALSLLVTATMLAVYGLLQDYWAQTGLQDLFPTSGGVRDWRAKVIATLGNPNFLGGYLGVSLPLLIAYTLRRDFAVWQYASCSICLMLVIACMTVTFCVGVTVGLIIAAVVGLGMMLFTRTLPTFSWLRGITLFVLLIGSNLWYTLDNPYNTHGTSLFLEAKSSPHWASGMGARHFNWRTSLIMMEENPATGIGFGNYLTKHIHYQGINYQQFGTAHDRDYVIPVDQPHFQLLETASECGPLGVLVICWVFCAWWKCSLTKLTGRANLFRKRNNETSNRHSSLILHHSSFKPWFAWGAFLGIIVAVGHSFSSFPFHLPATSLEIVVLASWFAATPIRKTQETIEVPKKKIIVASSCTAAVIFLSCSQLVSDMYLRAGNETQGVSAIASLKQAVNWNPFHYQNHFLLATRYIQLGWYDQALASCQNALQYQEDLKAHEYMARIHSIKGNFDQAVKEQKRVIELNPVFPGHYRDLINYLRQAGMDDEIPALEEKANQLDEEIKVKYAK